MNHTSARGFTVGASLVALAAAILLAASPARAQATGGSCDRVCLTGVMDTYLTAMAGQTPEKVPLAPGAIIFENIKPIALNASRWQNVTGLKSTTSFADPQTGNIVSRAAATNKDGATVYIGTRLKVTGKKIAEVETSFNERPISGVEAANVVTYDPIYDTIVPSGKRMTRAALEKIVLGYFDALGTKQPDPAEYDMRCDRFSSGNRVTHRGGGGRGMPPGGRNPGTAPGPPSAPAPAATTEAVPIGGRAGRGPVDNEEAGGNGDKGCLESIQGNPPWLHAIESRVPVVDPERGIAIGYTLLLYPNDRVMLISEVFKVLDGRFRMIDYIGIVETGIKTTGFPK